MINCYGKSPVNSHLMHKMPTNMYKYNDLFLLLYIIIHKVYNRSNNRIIGIPINFEMTENQ